MHLSIRKGQRFIFRKRNYVRVYSLSFGRTTGSKKAGLATLVLSHLCDMLKFARTTIEALGTTML
jgi:hypothetical protein